MAPRPKEISAVYKRNKERLRPLSIWINDIIRNCANGAYIKSSGELEMLAFHRDFIEKNDGPSYSLLRKIIELSDDVGMPSPDTLERLAVGLGKAKRELVTGKTLFDLIKKTHEVDGIVGVDAAAPDNETVLSAAVLDNYKQLSMSSRLDLAPKLMQVMIEDIDYDRASLRQKLAIQVKRNCPKVNDPVARFNELINDGVSVSRLQDLIACRKLDPPMSDGEAVALSQVLRDHDRRLLSKAWIKAASASD